MSVVNLLTFAYNFCFVWIWGSYEDKIKVNINFCGIFDTLKIIEIVKILKIFFEKLVDFTDLL